MRGREDDDPKQLKRKRKEKKKKWATLYEKEKKIYYAANSVTGYKSLALVVDVNVISIQAQPVGKKQ